MTTYRSSSIDAGKAFSTVSESLPLTGIPAGFQRIIYAAVLNKMGSNGVAKRAWEI
jgi:hypothetical protein